MEDFKLDNENKIVFGICAGLAKYLNTDVWFIRLLALALAVIHPCVWLFYLFIWLVTPMDVDDVDEERELYTYRDITVVDTVKNLFNEKLIKASYIGKIIYVISDESLYFMVSDDYQNDIKQCWKKMEKIETKNIEFNTPIFVSLKGKTGCICNGIVTDSDGNIWVKTGDSLHHIDDLALESKNYILEKIKQN
jgi:phage shock protein PspC (stress-responsive transcriptional regulator)